MNNSSLPHSASQHLTVSCAGGKARDTAWLWAIFLVGASITLTDGLLRSANTDWETTAQDALHYQPYIGAYVFAVVTLPLCFWYAQRCAARKHEAVLLWFVLCVTTYTKDFAYIKVPGLPLFITDLVLLSFLYQFRVWRRGSLWTYKPSWLFRLMVVYFLAGVFELLRSWILQGEFLLSVRDFTIVLYALFAVVIFEMILDREAVLRVLLMVWLGAMLAAIGAIGWFIAEPDQRRYVMYGAYLPAALVGTAIAGFSGVIPRRLVWTSTFLLGIGVLLQNARSSEVALAATLLVALVLKWVSSKKFTLGQLKPVLIIVLVAVLVLLVFSKTSAGSAFLERNFEELVSGTVNYSDDANAQFRFLAWAEAWGRFAQQPLVGEGYGIPFVFADVDTDPRPHNTYLTVLYKMGLLGFLPLLLCLIAFYGRAIKALRRDSQVQVRDLILIVACGHFLIASAGMVGLLLESPFLASVFWIAIGLQGRLTALVFWERSGRLPALTGLRATTRPIPGQ